MLNDTYPDLNLLVACGQRVAAAMQQREARRDRVLSFFRQLLLVAQDCGGKDVLGCLRAGIITETEARDVVMANFATWLSHENGTPEPSADTWVSSALDDSFEFALLGRAARR